MNIARGLLSHSIFESHSPIPTSMCPEPENPKLRTVLLMARETRLEKDSPARVTAAPCLTSEQPAITVSQLRHIVMHVYGLLARRDSRSYTQNAGAIPHQSEIYPVAFGNNACTRGVGWTGRGQLRAGPFSRVGPELLLIPPVNRVGGGCCSEETGRSTPRSVFVQVVGLLSTYPPLTVIVFVMYNGSPLMEVNRS